MAVDPFYLTPEWKALRRACLERDHHRCVSCGERAFVADHIIGRRRWLAENRHVSTLFIKLPTPRSDTFGLAQSLMLCIQAAEQRWHGMVRQLITDDKVRGHACLPDRFIYLLSSRCRQTWTWDKVSSISELLYIA